MVAWSLRRSASAAAFLTYLQVLEVAALDDVAEPVALAVLSDPLVDDLARGRGEVVNQWLRKHGKGDGFRNVIERRYLKDLQVRP